MTTDLREKPEKTLEANSYFQFKNPVTVYRMQIKLDRDVIRMVPPGISGESGLGIELNIDPVTYTHPLL